MIVEYQNLQQKIIAIIINEQSVSDAVSFLGEIKTFREKIEKQKKESVIELKEKIKEIEQPFKEMLKNIDDLELIIKNI
jgi:predicted  nucleic acid-binding Zn-ribbon protein